MSVFHLVRQIREYPPGDHVAAVERLADHDDPELRGCVPEVAAQLGYPRLAELCSGLLADRVWYVRCAACEIIYLATLAVPVELLLEMVDSDPHEFARSKAAFALGRVASASDIPRMLDLADVVQGENHEGDSIRGILLGAVEQVRSRTSS